MFSILSQILIVMRKQSSKLFSVRGFSIVGVLVIGSMGLIILGGMSKMLSNINTDMHEFKKTSSRHKSLVGQIKGLLLDPDKCRDSLNNSLGNWQKQELNKGGAGSTNTDPIKFFSFGDNAQKKIIDIDSTNREKIKRLYGIEGHSSLQLQCKSSPNCNCSSGPYPCPRNWSLSLFTMSYKNNLPVYKEIFNQELSITYNSSNQITDCSLIGSAMGIENTFHGTNAGISNTTGTNNSFYGFNAGKSNTTGNNNSFYGANAGAETTGGLNNSFYGFNAGKSNTTGNNNSFYGANAGENNTTGTNNSFYGANAGKKNTTGTNNSFYGYNAGSETTTQSDRLNIGNVIYGYINRQDDKTYPSSQGIHIHVPLRICNTSGQSCQNVCTDPVNCPQQSTPSSKEYKKNITPFKDEKKILSALLKTPLFTYQYKEDYPKKQRTGIISEELPKVLQMPVKPGEPVQPDWLSIYGYLWAGIKALHKELLDLKQLFFKNGESLKFLFQKELKTMEEPIRKKLKTENRSLKKRLENREQAIRLLKTRIQESKQRTAGWKKEVALLKKQEAIFQEELKKIKQQIQNE